MNGGGFVNRLIGLFNEIYMNLIVAVDKNWAIGYKGNLLEHLNNDMNRFKTLTTGKVIILGRETLSTFPNNKPLPNRTNIILSRNHNFKCPNAIIAHSINELLQITSSYNTNDIFVIGGSSIYEALLPYVNTAYITKFNNEHTCDRYFPNLDIIYNWKLTYTSDVMNEHGVDYTFNIYTHSNI